MPFEEKYVRTKMLLSDEAMQKLKMSTVAVFGLGGVGSYAAEAVARCGVGKMILVDADTVSESNINRQLYALSSTVGRKKTDVARERIKDIDETIDVEACDIYYSEDTPLDLSGISFIIDAIDSVASKVFLCKSAKIAGIPMISCMGTGNKLCPEKLEIRDIYQTSVCPLAKVMRQKLKAEGITSLPVVFSTEIPTKPLCDGDEAGKRNVGSISFVPSCAGLLAASYCIKYLSGLI